MNPVALYPILPGGRADLECGVWRETGPRTVHPRGPFSFLSKTPEQGVTDLPQLNEAAVVPLPAAASAGAAICRRFPFSNAKSRPFPFPNVNYVTHSLTSLFLPSTGAAIPNGGILFRDGGKR